MLIDRLHALPLRARRAFRLGFSFAISLAIAYGIALPLPFLAPLFCLILGAKGDPPPKLKGLVGLIVVVLLTMGVGLVLTPALVNYPVSAVLFTAVGIYFSTYVAIGKGKILVGLLLTVGMTLITAAGIVDYALAAAVVVALVCSIGLAILCQWIAYPLFPENESVAEQDDVSSLPDELHASWIALRASIIIMPAYLLTLTNPGAYLPIIMKTVSLAQQSTVVDARSAGRELLGSTLVAGALAIVFWWLLDLVTNLWVFFLLALLFGFFIAAKLFGALPSRYSADYWQNVGVTMVILLGSAVQDSANGDDVYTAFFTRMGLFIGVTIYAWLAIVFLDSLRKKPRESRILPKETSNA